MNKRQKRELNKKRRREALQNRDDKRKDFLISCSCHIAGNFMDVIYAMAVRGLTKQDYLRWITYSTGEGLEDNYWQNMVSILDKIKEKRRRSK